MRKSLILLGALAVAALLATSVSAANRGVTFTSIGFIENPGNFPASSVLDMNPEGTVFMVSPSFSNGYCVKWTREGGWGEQLGSAGGYCRISSEGTIMAGGIYPGSDPAYLWPGTWTGVTDGWDPIPPQPDYAPCGSSRMSFYDMGGNGDWAAGLTYAGCAAPQGFLWEKATNSTIGLGVTPPNGKATRANAVTADGSKVAGWTTSLGGSRRGSMWEDGSWTALNDPDFREPKVCAESGGYCTANSASTTTGCPEWVDDGFCVDRGTCTSGVCVGGTNAGNSCTSSSQCPGTCAGPNAGASCTSNGSCPDTVVCVPNPEWTDDLWKGETYDMTDDGRYATGQNFDNSAHRNSAYRFNPDGSFTEIPPPETFPSAVVPLRISQDGKTIAGLVGSPFFGSIPFFWREDVGTIDLQLFLVEQGLDELFFWNLTQAYTVSADGTIIGGRGFNPDNKYEGFIVDISKVWVCHTPPGNPDSARTLGVSLDGVADHLAHGDFLGTCEFLNSGGLSRTAELRDLRAQHLAELSMTNPAMLSVGVDVLSQWPELRLESPTRPRHGRSGSTDHRSAR